MTASGLAALLVALVVAGCGGFSATVPISPMMFMENLPPAVVPAPLGAELAVHQQTISPE